MSSKPDRTEALHQSLVGDVGACADPTPSRQEAIVEQRPRGPRGMGKVDSSARDAIFLGVRNAFFGIQKTIGVQKSFLGYNNLFLGLKTPAAKAAPAATETRAEGRAPKGRARSTSANFDFSPGQFLDVEFWDDKVGARRVGRRRVGAQKGGAQKGGGPKISRFFFPSLGVLSWFEAPGP